MLNCRKAVCALAHSPDSRSGRAIVPEFKRMNGSHVQILGPAAVLPVARTRISASAGFSEPESEFVRMAWRFDDFDGYWEFLVRLAGSLAMTINKLPPDEQKAVRSDVRELLSVDDKHSFDLTGVTLNSVTS
jgi:hypothetical protein